jgi:hypothetical protein
MFDVKQQLSYKSVSARSLAIRAGFVAAAVVVLFTFFASTADAQYHPPMQIGVRCEDTFQGGYPPDIDVYPACSDFINQIGKTDNVDFYFNLVNAAPAFESGNANETCLACGGVDSVDFFFMITHGTIANNNANYAGYAMWNSGSIAWTPQMRFGDAGKNAKIFATFSCDTFKTSDGLFWSRWNSPYHGGLKIGVGGHDLLYVDNSTTAATDFVTRMQSGQAIGGSWLEALWYANNSNHPSVANTGVNSTDCWNRQGATMASVQTIPTLRDGSIGYVCWSGWNGD